MGVLGAACAGYVTFYNEKMKVAMYRIVYYSELPTAHRFHNLYFVSCILWLG